ncbi:hypothetical protein [Paenarthrobacter sp. CM16]|uniref:hypothetical protein n=1 Tax=Paenarthrobacter sp. CM16 TaxID=2738447 RepID=UPI0020A6D8E5|nr:hypothetical protein [Paenarthrobacter sp. CM16]
MTDNTRQNPSQEMLADVPVPNTQLGPPSQMATSAPTPRTELSLAGLLIGATAIVALFGALTAGISALSPLLTGQGPTYTDWVQPLPNDLLTRAQWALGDMTEPQFYKSWLASLGLLAGAALAWWAGSRNKKWAGMPISYGTGLWPWIFGSATLSLVLSNLAFGGGLGEGWQPTFVPFVCVATATVLVYGKGWPVFLTGAILGAATTTPVAMVLINFVTGPLALPPVVANTLAMSIGAAATFIIARYLPWMRLPKPAPQQDADAPTGPPAPVRTIPGTPTLIKDAVWTVRRVIADFTETQFYANELASIGVILGVVAAFLMNPLLPAYGTNLLPQILFVQALTSAIGVIVWRKLYRAGGWAPTYISVVSVGPASVLAYNGSALSIIGGAVAGALLCPLIARAVSARLPEDFHPFIGNTISMAISVAIIVPGLGLFVG